MDVVRSLFRNAAFSMVTSLLNRLANTLLFIYVVQELGVSAAGVYTTGVSYFFISSRFAFWGLDHLLTREVASDRRRVDTFFSNFLLLRVLLGLATIAVFVLIVQIAPYPSQTQLVISVMLLTVLPENINNLCWATFAAFEQFHLASIGTLLGGLLKVGGGFFLVWQGQGILAVAVMFVLSSFVTMVVNLVLVRRRYVTAWVRPLAPFLRKQLRVAVPFIFVGIFFVLDNRLDTVVLSLLADEAAVGYYAAATAVIVALSLIPEGYRIAILPVLARFRSSPDSIRRLYDQSFKYLVLLAIPLGVAAFTMANELIPLIYRQRLPQAVPALRIMAVALPFIFLNVLNNRLLIVHNRQDLVARALGVTVVQNILINVLIVPRFGASGAAIARLASLVTLFVLTALPVRDYVPSPWIWRHLWRPGIASLGMLLLIYQLQPYGIWIQTLVGGLAYLVALLLLGVLTPGERRRLYLFLVEETPLKRL